MYSSGHAGSFTKKFPIMISTLKEFKPALWFLGKFLGVYLLGNLAYGLFIENYKPLADPVTRLVSANTCSVLNVFGYSTSMAPHPTSPSVIIRSFGEGVINVYEGCNSVNVMVVFIAFMVAFGGFSQRKLWFTVFGLVIIYLLNLTRVTFLFWVAERIPDYLYFVHKYLFTGIIYLVVFLLWYLWIFRLNEKPAVQS